MKQKPKKRLESNDRIYWSIIITFAVLSIGTFFHEFCLHGIIAILNGWTIESWNSGLMTGSTSVLASVNATTSQYWTFFMFPAIAIFLFVILVTFIRPEREIMTAGIILMALNLPSLNPAITGSDAEKAAAMLIKTGTAESTAYIFHYVLFVIFLIIWALFLYISIENNPKDSRKRIENLYQ